MVGFNSTIPTLFIGPSSGVGTTGNVGINTTVPQSLLDVQGAAGAAGILTLATKELTVVDGDVLGRIDFNAPLESAGSDAILVGASIWAEADDTFSATVNSTELVFATGTSAAATEKMRIDRDGNVGIGTASPGDKLEVNGNVQLQDNSLIKLGFPAPFYTPARRSFISSEVDSAYSGLSIRWGSGSYGAQTGPQLQFNDSSARIYYYTNRTNQKANFQLGNYSNNEGQSLIFSGGITDYSNPNEIAAQTINSQQGRLVMTANAYTETMTGNVNAVSITPTYNQASGTAANTDLLINRTETAVGSGLQYLLDTQVGGTSRFNISNTGQGYFAGNVGIGDVGPDYPLEILSTTNPQFAISNVDATHYATFGVDGSGDLALTVSGGNISTASSLAIGTVTANDAKLFVYGGSAVIGGAALATDATDGFLYIPSSAGAPTGTPTTQTGTVPIQYDTTNNRLYAYRGGAWHYFAETAGFQIPDFETADPISGEKIQEGDIVLGMVDKTMSDDALHATWVTWNSVKKQLLAEARGELSSSGAWKTGAVEGVSTETMLDKVTNILTSIGINVKDGVTSIANLAVNNFTAKKADISKLQMTDEITGEIYCVSIRNGEMVRVKGECSSSVIPAPSVIPAEAGIQSEGTDSVSSADSGSPIKSGMTTGESGTAPSSDGAPAAAGGSNNVFDEQANEAQEIIEQAQQAANNALETSQNAQQQVEQTAKQAAKEAAKELKEEIKKEVKEELSVVIPAQAGIQSEGIGPENQQNTLDSGFRQNDNGSEPEPEPALELVPAIEQIIEPVQEILEPVIDAAEEAAAGLMNGAKEFAAWLFEAIFQFFSRFAFLK